LSARLQLIPSGAEAAERLCEVVQARFSICTLPRRRCKVSLSLSTQVGGTAHRATRSQVPRTAGERPLNRFGKAAVFSVRLCAQRSGCSTPAFKFASKARGLGIKERVFGFSFSGDKAAGADDRTAARDDQPTGWKILQRVKRTRNGWCHRNPSEDALENPIWITDDLTAEPRERWMVGDRRLCHSFNQERTLLIVEKGRAASVNDESARERTEGGEHCAAPLFTNLNASQ
jgi:hypothetical protein